MAPSVRTKTAIQAIGEAGLIARIQEWVPLNKDALAVRKGIGDDSAVYAPSEGMCQVVSTDMLVEGTHFDLSYMPLKHLGYKAVVVSVSDIVSMMARPRYFLCSLGLGGRFSVEDTSALFEGIRAACTHYDIHLIGGDTVSSQAGLLLNGTALGECEEDSLVYRSGAKEGDVIGVSGDLGSAYLGLEVLRAKKKSFAAAPTTQPDLTPYRYLVGRQIKPEARTDIRTLLRSHQIKPQAMMDLSDGLSVSLHALCKASKVGAVIEAERLPIHEVTAQTAAELHIEPMVCALHGGEDYELLWTMPQSDWNKIAAHPDVHCIGHVQAESKGIKLLHNNTEQLLEGRAWQHFSSKDGRTRF